MNNGLAILLPIGQRLSFIQLVNPYVFFDFIQWDYYVASMLGSIGLHLQGFFKVSDQYKTSIF
jgi:hypothetical protein